MVRFDLDVNAHGTFDPRLDAYPNVARWANALLGHSAFARATDLTPIAAPFGDPDDSVVLSRLAPIRR